MDQVTLEIAAPPEKLWALITDIADMGRWSPECLRCQWLDGASGPAVGARFKGKNKRGLMSWSTTSTVTQADEPKVFEWQVDQSGMLWGYRFEPTPDGGTKVTEYRDKTRDIPFHVKLVQRSGLIGRDRETLMVKGMHETLNRLKEAAEA